MRTTWTDERYSDRVMEKTQEYQGDGIGAWKSISLACENVALEMRDDYEATIAAQTQRISELEAQLAKTEATLRHTIAENMALIDELDKDEDEDE